MKRRRDDKLREEVKEDQAGSREFVVLPGDLVSLPAHAKIRLGAGLQQERNDLLATKCGVFRQTAGAHPKMTIENLQKRYIPAMEDLVIGTVIEKHPENYRIDIGTTHPARLNALAFEGATKRNRPNIQVGSLVYARVALCNKHMETELVCTSPHFKKDWVAGQSLFGELSGGYAFKCSLRLAAMLLDEDCHVLRVLGKFLPFELAIGANGMVWVNSTSAKNTVVISNMILASEFASNAAVEKLISQVMANMS